MLFLASTNLSCVRMFIPPLGFTKDDGRTNKSPDATGSYYPDWWIQGASDGPSLDAAPPIVTNIEIRANSVTTDSQSFPVVTTFSDGHFAIAWKDYTDGSNAGIRAQVFAADGHINSVGPYVNGYTPDHQGDVLSIGALSDNRFIVTWRSAQGSSEYEQIARFIAADGTPLGTDIIVNPSLTSYSHHNGMVAIFPNDDFAVT